jgi:hypothetical protein
MLYELRVIGPDPDGTCWDGDEGEVSDAFAALRSAAPVVDKLVEWAKLDKEEDDHDLLPVWGPPASRRFPDPLLCSPRGQPGGGEAPRPPAARAAGGGSPRACPCRHVPAGVRPVTLARGIPGSCIHSACGCRALQTSWGIIRRSPSRSPKPPASSRSLPRPGRAV